MDYRIGILIFILKAKKEFNNKIVIDFLIKNGYMLPEFAEDRINKYFNLLNLCGFITRVEKENKRINFWELNKEKINQLNFE